jgi:hypothetical protein
MALLIDKEDFTAANLVKFSQNILADQIEPFIYAAQEYDLEPRLGADLYEALQHAHGGGNGHGDGHAGTNAELLAFLNSKVKRFLVLASYRRFISAHGLNVTQFGLTKTADPQGTFNQAEAAERAVILKQIDADANVALLKMTSTPYIFDGVSYTKSTTAGNPSQSIRAPKRFRDSLEKRVAAAGTFGFMDLID